jgi:hypothetical protein
MVATVVVMVTTAMVVMVMVAGVIKTIKTGGLVLSRIMAKKV